MQQTTDDSNRGRSKVKHHGLHTNRHDLLTWLKKKKVVLFIGGIIVAFIFLIILIALLSSERPHRSESYKNASGAAGLQANITYGRHCNQQPCDHKQSYDFNVYIYRDDGQQVNVVRPDKDGNVNLALPEGNYVMLIGKRFGKDKIFPQEPLVLKNGKMLELKLDYE